MKPGFALLLVFLPWIVSAQTESSEPAAADISLQSPLEPRELFRQMLESERRYSFRGSVAFERSGSLTTFEFSNRVVDGSFLQALQPLNRVAAGRLFFNGCNATAQQALVEPEDLIGLYNFYRPDDSLVAGRSANELLLLPTDNFRYGYGFSIDRDTRLMLRSVVLSPQREALERLEFVELEILALEKPNRETAALCEPQQSTATGWSVVQLPAGFELVNEKQDGATARLIYSDGMSAISVFVEPVVEPKFPAASTFLGATNLLLSYARSQDQLYLVTLVGEVPLRSLELMSTGLRQAVASETETEAAIEIAAP